MADAKGWTESAVKQFDALKSKVVGWWKGTDAKKALGDMQAVGQAAKTGGQQVTQATHHAGQSVHQLGTSATQSAQQIRAGAQQAGQSFQTVSAAAGSAASQTKSHLESIGGVVGKGSSWGANLIDMVSAGIQSKLPGLAAVASKAASTIKNFLGFSSPTKMGPASKSDKWAPNFMNMFVGGLDEQMVGQKMKRVASMMNQPFRAQTSVDVMPRSQAAPGSDIPISRQFAKPSGMTIQVGDVYVTFDIGEMLDKVENGTDFLKVIASPQGKSVLKNVMNQVIVEACELGG
jgi:phage-related protein